MKYYSFELHAHSEHSDGKLSVCELVEFVKSRGLSGIAKTDHNTADGNARFAELCEKEGIIAIKGLEITNFGKGDATVLGQNASNYVHTIASAEHCNGLMDFPVQQFSATAQKAIELGGSVGYAHPYRFPPARTLENYDDLSGEEKVKVTHIEVWNSPNLESNTPYKDATRLYLDILQKRPITAVAGSDFHRPSSLGTVYPITYIGMDETPDADKAVEAILKHKTYLAYGWRIEDNDPYLDIIGGSIKAGKLEQTVTIERLTPPLTGNYFDSITPQTLEVIACGTNICSTISASVFKLIDDKTKATATISATLTPNTRIILRIQGTADGRPTPIILTSPIEIVEG